MKFAEFIVRFLAERNVKDAFGIPGGVILELIYAMENSGLIKPHLMFHEQSASFAAAGYAQYNNTLGVAYATRGPGITNMLTGIADAYCDSIPIMFITAHNTLQTNHKKRIEADQEIDIVKVCQPIIKYAVRVDDIDSAENEFVKCCYHALNGRKGPVLIDIYSPLFGMERKDFKFDTDTCPIGLGLEDKDIVAEYVFAKLRKAKSPVILTGDGIHQANGTKELREYAEKTAIPVLSSRCSADVMADSDLYFGYIGSHGTRYANFILSKADLIISIGNRLSFPSSSESYRLLLEDKEIIQIDIDKTELKFTDDKQKKSFFADAKLVLEALTEKGAVSKQWDCWLSRCRAIKEKLQECDLLSVNDTIGELMQNVSGTIPFVCDVGNNEFWCSQSYVRFKLCNRILYSKSFGSLGSSVAKSIGVFYKTRKAVICFIGDQGLQMNIQELQFISNHEIPIKIVVLNNEQSGMIKDRQKERFQGRFLHTTFESGYSCPDIKKIARAYELRYLHVEKVLDQEEKYLFQDPIPLICEVSVNREEGLRPSLPKGRKIQDMFPDLPIDIWNYLESL